jgi:hypothetical protein
LVEFVSPFLVSVEVGQLYLRRGLQRPVSGATGLWCLLGVLILIEPIIWFVKTNNAPPGGRLAAADPLSTPLPNRGRQRRTTPASGYANRTVATAVRRERRRADWGAEGRR